MTCRTIAALLDSLVDYAGLFPPAGLPMDAAVTRYARYREENLNWILGRFVAPASLLAELRESWTSSVPSLRVTSSEPLRVSALVNDTGKDLEAIAAFHANGGGIVDAIEVKVSAPGEIAAFVKAMPHALTTYFELPLRDDLDEFVAAVAESGARAKIRTGGLTPDAFPHGDAIVRFIELCARRDVAFKATAGLHHPLRCTRPLTYEPGSITGKMHGFVNVFLAATLIRDGGAASLATELLADEVAASFVVADESIQWRDVEFRAEAIAQTRRDFAISFGSCSFEEPVNEMKQLGWL